MTDNLLKMVQRLQVENEINKILIHGLKTIVFYRNNEKIDECLESIKFTSDIIQVQIRESWSEEESIFFRQRMDEEIHKFSLLYSSESE